MDIVAAAAIKVLVTGGCGFIGRFVVAELLLAGYEVSIVDNLSVSERDVIPARCRFTRADLSDARVLHALLTSGGFDFVVHLAGSPSEIDSFRDSSGDRARYLDDTRNLLSACAEAGVRGLLFPSTSRIYADVWPEVKREDSITRPIDPYAEAKRAAELYLQEAAPRLGVKLGILRLFNVAGAHPRGLMGRDFRSSGHMVKALCSVATGRQAAFELRAFGLPTRDGTAIRDYVHVHDVARAFRMTLETLDWGAENLLFNVGTGRGMTILEMIRLAEKVFDRRLPVVRVSQSSPEISALVANIERIEHAIGWSPRYGVREILEHAWQWERTAPEARSELEPAGLRELSP